mgnify:CR=1 FL=1
MKETTETEITETKIEIAQGTDLTLVAVTEREDTEDPGAEAEAEAIREVTAETEIETESIRRKRSIRETGKEVFL